MTERKAFVGELISEAIAVFIIINLINPQFMRPMLNSTFGIMSFAVAAVMVITGYAAMMKIADIDI